MDHNKTTIGSAARSGAVGTALLTDELHACFNYFCDNFSRSEAAFGLMPDRIPDVKGKSSIAATGYMLAAMAVGADFGWISPDEAQQICHRTLQTLLQLPSDKGFYFHFYETATGLRYKQSELSTIDSALLFCGALTAGGYFGGEILRLAQLIAQRADWGYFYDPDRKMFRMARYDDVGWVAHWDYFAEQLMIYVLAAANGFPQARTAYQSFGRLHGFAPNGQDFVYTWCGTLFTHQFSHAFVDFRNITDADGFDWFANSVTASVNDRLFCAGQPQLYPDGIWGLTSCATPDGYCGRIGSAPSGNNDTEHISDGTVPPCGALGSIVFTPAESLAALDVFSRYQGLAGPYGLYDSFNPSKGWVAHCYISIDKGITLLMGANYLRSTVWSSFHSVRDVPLALDRLGFVPKHTQKQPPRADKNTNKNN